MVLAELLTITPKVALIFPSSENNIFFISLTRYFPISKQQTIVEYIGCSCISLKYHRLMAIILVVVGFKFVFGLVKHGSDNFILRQVAESGVENLNR